MLYTAIYPNGLSHIAPFFRLQAEAKAHSQVPVGNTQQMITWYRSTADMLNEPHKKRGRSRATSTRASRASRAFCTGLGTYLQLRLPFGWLAFRWAVQCSSFAMEGANVARLKVRNFNNDSSIGCQRVNIQSKSYSEDSKSVSCSKRCDAQHCSFLRRLAGKHFNTAAAED